MRIGIDARFYGPRVGGGGLGRYTAELVTALQELDKENEYVLFLRKENFHECVITNGKFTKRMVDVPWYSFAEQREMPREIALAKVNLMHYPHWNVPIFSRVPFVVTIHDLILLEDPASSRATTRNAFVHGIKSIGYRIALEVAIHRSKHIVAISEYTKRSILEHFRVSGGKISVVYNGVRPPVGAEKASLVELGVQQPYILSVGNAYPHKNLETTLMGFRKLCTSDERTMLVLAGKRDMFVEKLEAFALEIGIPSSRIRFVNTPTDAVLARLYQDAALLVIASRIEGFGIPPLEALAIGIPVAASHTSSLPEVLGNTVRYFDPDDTDALARLMNDAVHQPSAWRDLKGLGIRQAEKFSWKKTALLMRDIYRNFADRRL